MTVLLISSRPAAGPEADLGDWEKRFERYAASAGRRIRVLTDAGGVKWPGVLLGSDDSSAVIVFWDPAARVPPKEIEVLTQGLKTGEWRVGVRSAGPGLSRGLSGLRRIGMRTTGWIRRRFGAVWDAHPPCLAVLAGTFGQRGGVLLNASADRRIPALLRAVRRERGAIVEVPVMWAVK